MIAYAVPGWIACECGAAMAARGNALPSDSRLKMACVDSRCKNNGVEYWYQMPVAALVPVEWGAS